MTRHDNSWLQGLNEQQQGAVVHGDGPLLVVAGAGSGKTRTLAYRVAYLLSQGVEPQRILLLTFTRRAAEEMLSRAAGIIALTGTIPPSAVSQVWGGTFHSVANRLLRIYGGQIGLSAEFTIMDQSDSEDLMNLVRQKEAVAPKDKRFPKKNTCCAIYSRRVNTNDSLETVIRDHFPWCEQWKQELKRLFKAYVEYKQRRHVLDYDDLLLYWYHSLSTASIAESMEKRFDHILVDEYQDTNVLQAAILQRLRQANTNIMAVGDDCQSIYSFRAASVRNMFDFHRQFPGATMLTLERNYRCVQPVLTSTNTLIAQAKQRFPKNLFTTQAGGQKPKIITCKDEACQDEAVIRLLLLHREDGIPLRKQAVLFRAGAHSASLELSLARNDIPFRKFGGLRFLEAAHIKDFLSLVRIVENPADEMAWMRLLMLLEGVGPVTAGALFDAVQKSNYDFRGLAAAAVTGPAQADVRSLGELLHAMSRLDETNLATQLELCRNFYLPLLEKNYENSQPRSNDIAHLVALANRFTSRKQFLSELMLDPPASTSDFAAAATRDEEWLTLSTIHSAKGCEWDAVYIIHVVDGCIPSDLALEDDERLQEELRLMYVAMTRCKQFLYLLWPLRLYSHGRSMSDWHTYSQQSRFLTPEVVATFDCVTADAARVRHDAVEGSLSDNNRSIQDEMRLLWD
ncbi:MAG: ATP-dependent helicase [Chitinivibrionales bacterium]|nr:ATP-dependent helicase [Chitinivibrionales bacterium]